MHHTAFLSQEPCLGLLFLQENMVEKKHQPLLPIVNHPRGRLKTGGDGFQK